MADESDRLWKEDAERYGWIMPSAPLWKRLPIIRHVRCTYHGMRAEQFRRFTSALGLGIGGISQYDRWVLYGIARGFERPTTDEATK